MPRIALGRFEVFLEERQVQPQYKRKAWLAVRGGIQHEGEGPPGAFAIRQRSCFVLGANGRFRGGNSPPEKIRHNLLLSNDGSVLLLALQVGILLEFSRSVLAVVKTSWLLIVSTF